MKVGIIGLGLMGGSMAKALSGTGKYTVEGYDSDGETLRKALSSGAVARPLTKDGLSSCDIVVVALWPQAAVDYIKENAQNFSKSCTVIDICGVKRFVCESLYDTARENGFVFVGAHPMAGYHLSGFENSKAEMFKNASAILTPYENTPEKAVKTVREMFLNIGFARVVISTPGEHDRIIAFTSQLAHVVSNAYVKSPEAAEHSGFSAGSYKDLTRVAYLNEDMWSELFLENGDNLVKEIDSIVEHLVQYKEAIENGDRGRLRSLLREGKLLKKQIDG